MAKLRKKSVELEPFKLGLRGYVDAPATIEKAMKKGPLVENLFPDGTTFELKQSAPVEKNKMLREWQRYRIKDHERGHRKPLSLKLKTPTRRFNTCTTLPENVYVWIKTKKNRAGYLRSLLLKEFRKTENG